MGENWIYVRKDHMVLKAVEEGLKSVIKVLSQILK
jgi:hypothetical protein